LVMLRRDVLGDPGIHDDGSSRLIA